jgi:phosphate acyltransferase
LAVFHQKDSSLVKSLDLLKEDPSIQGLVSLSSSGALLVGSVVKIGKLPGVTRPAFCPLLPTMNHHFVAVCDSGASSECSKDELLQFGIMASEYLKKAYGIASPRVALLNIGTEEGKGDTLRKEAYPLFKASPYINFVGNMEARELTSGDYDVVACDGFSGNVLIKSTEGTGIGLLKLLKTTFFKNFKNKMGALFLKKDIYAIKDFMDYNNYGGAVMLGLQKIVIKGHGSGNSASVYHCIEQAYNGAKNGLIDSLKDAFKTLEK